MKRKAFIQTKQCVACGCCMKVCPRSAITIPNGVSAQVDLQRCVGCGKCAAACPASIIELSEVSNETQTLV